MKLLIAVQDYPNNFGGKNEAYVHTRNLEYVKSGIEVNVVNFSAAESYLIDEITVLTEKDVLKKGGYYDYLVCHAANIRNHYRFIKKYGQFFNKIFFFFHGHEVLKIHKVYPKDYPYIKTNTLKYIFQDTYDAIKCRIWHNYFTKARDNYYCIFVSEWMYHEFQKWINAEIRGKYSIIYNVVGTNFLSKHYNSSIPKEYDFVTIRSSLDGSKYCIDLVNELAKTNPSNKFLVIGRGKFFEYNKKADNLIWINNTLNHSEVIEILNKCKCALMPTRTDAQGVMACEFATFGIPMITSDIEVCQEVFNLFPNVAYINNEKTEINLDKIYTTIKDQVKGSVLQYDLDHTVMKEIQLFERMQ